MKTQTKQALILIQKNFLKSLSEYLKDKEIHDNKDLVEIGENALNYLIQNNHTAGKSKLTIFEVLEYFIFRITGENKTQTKIMESNRGKSPYRRTFAPAQRKLIHILITDWKIIVPKNIRTKYFLIDID
jgi:predicted nucleotidyltransferase